MAKTRLQEKYLSEAVKGLMDKFNYKNVMEIPKIEKVVLRQGMPIGAKVTLRGDRMYYFLDKLMNIALPRVRDFRGVSPTAFDGRGNYALGLKEQLIFPEIDYDKIDKVRGMDIIIVTTAKTDEEARELLRILGMPFSA